MNEPAAHLVRAPLVRAPRAMRALRSLFAAVARWPLGWRLELIGAEHLPRDPRGRPCGGWIAAGVPHITWVEPFVLLVLLPSELRLVWFGDARAISRSRLRRAALNLLGGVVPIQRGGGPSAFSDHIAAARATLDAGSVFVIFPEVGPPSPPGRARPMGGGLGYLAIRTGAPVVPLVFGGTDELYLGRRIRLQVLPPVTAAEVLESEPAALDSDERDEARRFVERFHELVAPAIAEAHQAVAPRPRMRKRWRWLTHALH